MSLPKQIKQTCFTDNLYFNIGSFVIAVVLSLLFANQYSVLQKLTISFSHVPKNINQSEFDLSAKKTKVKIVQKSRSRIRSEIRYLDLSESSALSYIAPGKFSNEAKDIIEAKSLNFLKGYDPSISVTEIRTEDLFFFTSNKAKLIFCIISTILLMFTFATGKAVFKL